MAAERQSLTGRYVSLPQGGVGFIPKPLPPDPPFEVDHEMWSLLSEADRATGRLDGAAAILPNPDLFVAMYVRKEAVLSSQIEGVQATLADLLEYEIARPTLREVLAVGKVVNYVAALMHGIAALRRGPIDVALVRELHARLLAGTRGGRLQPGEFRDRQNWLGPEGCAVTEAGYVPPPPEEVGAAMAALAGFIRKPGPLPPLVVAGLAHAQFESIHPFFDGNGRVGRLLVVLMLRASGVIRQPLLYPSLYLKLNRAEYYDRLQATRDPGNWEGWLKFFVRVITRAADDGAHTARRVVGLREEHRRMLQSGLGKRAADGLALLERLYQNPIADVNHVAAMLRRGYPSANRLVARLVELGLLKEVTGHARNRRFVYQPYLDIFEKG